MQTTRRGWFAVILGLPFAGGITKIIYDQRGKRITTQLFKYDPTWETITGRDETLISSRYMRIPLQLKSDYLLGRMNKGI